MTSQPHHCNPARIAVIEPALKTRGDLAVLGSIDRIRLQEGASPAAVPAAARIAGRLGHP